MLCLKCNLDKPEADFDAKPSTGVKKRHCRDCCRQASRVAKAKAREFRQKFGTAKNVGRTYESRQRVLQAIGFRTYKEYLASDLWKSIRRRVFAAKGDRCYLCGGRATQAHHNRYTVSAMLGKKIKQIHPVCDPCHEGIEFKDGKKTTVRQAAKAFKTIRREHLSGDQGQGTPR